jgi:hypothetical protein
MYMKAALVAQKEINTEKKCPVHTKLQEWWDEVDPRIAARVFTTKSSKNQMIKFGACYHQNKDTLRKPAAKHFGTQPDNRVKSHCGL